MGSVQETPPIPPSPDACYLQGLTAVWTQDCQFLVVLRLPAILAWEEGIGIKRKSLLTE